MSENITEAEQAAWFAGIEEGRSQSAAIIEDLELRLEKIYSIASNQLTQIKNEKPL